MSYNLQGLVLGKELLYDRQYKQYLGVLTVSHQRAQAVCHGCADFMLIWDVEIQVMILVYSMTSSDDSENTQRHHTIA